MRLWIGWVGIVAAALACESPVAPDVAGAWGGAEASLTLSRLGGTVQYLCGAGTIGPSWTVSETGVFAATGQHYFGGGPVPPGGRMPHPAEYAGQINGTTLTFTVTVSDVSQTLGPFQVVRGGAGVTETCQ